MHPADTYLHHMASKPQSNYDVIVMSLCVVCPSTVVCYEATHGFKSYRKPWSMIVTIFLTISDVEQTIYRDFLRFISFIYFM